MYSIEKKKSYICKEKRINHPNYNYMDNLKNRREAEYVPIIEKFKKEIKGIKKIEPVILNKVDTKEEYLNRVKDGFNAVMDYGYGKNVMGNAPKPSGKTGTSESFIDTNMDGKIDTLTTSNSFVGYSPRDNPIMTITVTSPDVEDPNTNINYHSYVNRRIAREISNKFFEMYE